MEARCIPRAWQDIATAKGRSEKVRLTLRIEADVVWFLRKMGKGYQEGMNDVLSAWMHGRPAALIEGPDEVDIFIQIDRPRLGERELVDRGLIRGWRGATVGYG